MKTLSAGLLVSLLAALALTPAARGSAPSGAASKGPEFVPGQVLVKFRGGSSDRDKSDARNRVGGFQREQVTDDGLELLSVPPGLLVADAVRSLKGHATVEYAEPNWTYTLDSVSNDPLYTDGLLWNMYGSSSTPKNRFGCQAAEAWAAGHTGSRAVYVGIIDSGVFYTHEDLAANFWTNPFDLPDGVDNDGNGYIDDVHGWDFVHHNNTVFDGAHDLHGTHVAGTIGAVGGNGTGVAGVCWNVTLISAKAFDHDHPGDLATLVKAMDYFTDLKTQHGLDIVATNNSYGSGHLSVALQQAIARAEDANILVVAAAGNYGHNNDRHPIYPSSYPNDNIISVAAINKEGVLWPSSDYGPRSVDIGAPGVDIWSTIPYHRGGILGGSVSAYLKTSGTSMAAAHVTGAAALFKSRHPGASWLNVKNAILLSGFLYDQLIGVTATGRRLNVEDF